MYGVQSVQSRQVRCIRVRTLRKFIAFYRAMNIVRMCNVDRCLNLGNL